MALHERIETGFASWGAFVCHRRWFVSVACLAITAVLGSWLPHLRSDNSVESFLLPQDPARERYRDFQDLFGHDQFLVVSVRPPSLFDPSFLERLREFHETLEREVPYVEEVTSLINVRHTRGEEDELVVEELFEHWPETDAELELLRQRILASPTYVNTVIDREGTVTLVSLEPALRGSETDLDSELAGFGDEPPEGSPSVRIEALSDAEVTLQVDTLREVVARFDADDFELLLSGQAVMNRHSTESLVRDVRVFVGGACLGIAILLFVLFRRLSGVVLPLIVVLCSLVACFGLMALVDLPSSVSSQVLPVLLLTVGVCNSVHLLTIVYQRIAAGEGKHEAIAQAMGHSGLAVLMTNLTTAGGLLSFAVADYAQVVNLGKVAPAGIMLGFVYSVTLLPALVAIAPLRMSAPRGGRRLESLVGGFLARLAGVSTGYPWRVLAATAAVLVFAGFGVANLRFAQFPLEWFPEGDPLRFATEQIDRDFHGANTLEVLIDSGRPDGLKDPDLMKRIDRAMAFSEEFEAAGISAGKAVSIVNIIKETHRALNENRPEFYAIPDDRLLLAQELLLFENSGSDDLEDVVDTQFQIARMSVRLPQVDGMYYTKYTAALGKELREILGDQVGVELTGLGMLFGRTFDVVNTSMAKSYALALLIITPMMVLLIGDLRTGLLAMIPNLIPVFLTLGLMGWMDIPLDNSSLLVGCILIGLAVDDTIHFMHKFQRYFVQTGSARAAVQETFATTGHALLFTSLVLSAGFGVMTFAYMQNAVEFGQLALFATISAFLADLLVAPAIMTLFKEGAAARDVVPGKVGAELDPEAS